MKWALWRDLKKKSDNWRSFLDRDANLLRPILCSIMQQIFSSPTRHQGHMSHIFGPEIVTTSRDDIMRRWAFSISILLTSLCQVRLLFRESPILQISLQHFWWNTPSSWTNGDSNYFWLRYVILKSTNFNNSNSIFWKCTVI